ncbi:MAG: hypothetical protein ABIV39_07670 [Verrucomicrobiota bacterium]
MSSYSPQHQRDAQIFRQISDRLSDDMGAFFSLQFPRVKHSMLEGILPQRTHKSASFLFTQ